MSDTVMGDTAPIIPAEVVAKPAKHESIRLRYVVTLTTQLFRMACSAVTAGILPRVLGPVVFGNYNFLLTTATTLRSFSDLGAYNAFFTFSSKNRHSGPLTKLFGLWVCFQLMLSLATVELARHFGFMNWLFPGQRFEQILLVIVLEWLVYLVLCFQALGDSKKLNVVLQVITSIGSLLTALGIVFLAKLGYLNFNSYVSLLTLVAMLSCLVCGLYLLGRNKQMSWSGDLKNGLKKNITSWWNYANPLIAITVYGLAVNYLDTYIIQRSYGSSEQGYLALARRWSSLVLIFNSSAVTIYWRELADFLGANNIPRAAHVFHRFNRQLFSITLVLSCWLCFNAATLVLLLAGNAYRASIPILMIMAFYPVQQTYGQMNTVAFLASERTAIYRNVSMFLSIPSVGLTYLLLAQKTHRIPGLQLGAMGIALKLVVFGLISVQLYEWLNCRFFHISYGKMILEKVIAIVVVVGTGALSIVAAGRLLKSHFLIGDLGTAMITTPFYFSLITVIIYCWPSLAGLESSDLDRLLGTIRRWMLSFGPKA